MFFKKKKNYTIKPNFVNPLEDPELLGIAMLSMLTQCDTHKASFITNVIAHWVFDEDNKRFLPKEKGVEWMAKRISSGDGEALSAEIHQAIEASMQDDKDKEINRLFGIE